jgi:type VI secretion system protein ImpF
MRAVPTGERTLVGAHRLLVSYQSELAKTCKGWFHMARRDATPRFQHSLWDRLTDPRLIHGADTVLTESAAIKRIKQQVRRDLEWLLNSRSLMGEFPAGMEALETSLLRYGLPDLSSANLDSSKERDRFQSVLAKVIRDFEPRLDRIEVRLSDEQTSTGGRPRVHYRVEAFLKLDPTPLAVVFDTVLELGTKTFRVEG